VGLGESVFAVCGRVWGAFGGVSLCCVWERLVWVWGSECVLCVGQFGVGLGECVFVVCGRVSCGFGELLCSVCGRVSCRFMGVSLCYVWDSLGRV